MQIPARILTLVFLGAAAVFGQSTFGVVVGAVKDPSSAVVKGAVVKLTNVGENISQETLTSADGNYEFQNVKPGDYELTVHQPGFRVYNATGLAVVARQTL